MDSDNRSKNILFENFKVVPKANDHYYLQSHNFFKYKINFSSTNYPLHAIIMKEWKILTKNLPESIYVQVYETRIDLLRAMIIGSPGTPYHDGLFFFDILLPSQYPDQPPMVYYHSHGYRLNPNLYANGHVCLSLINTWIGCTVEKWSQESTILQVLVSIQGMVLNERPYFNEPTYENAKNSNDSKWIDGSLEYNEDVFIYSCLTMLNVIKKPPMNFEDFVCQHFLNQGDSILAAIECYIDCRALVGGQFDAPSSSLKIRDKFKNDLLVVHHRLKFALDKMKSGMENEGNIESAKEVVIEKARGDVKKDKKRLFSKFTSYLKCFMK